MPALKLTRLPDRKPVRITIKLDPGLNRSLERYAALYSEAYGEAESVATLIPFMLDHFLNDDRAFAKAMKSNGTGTEAEILRRRSGRTLKRNSSSSDGVG